MDSASLNLFLARFITIADSGFGLIAGDVAYVLNALIVISIALTGAQWALAQEAPLAPLFRKVLLVGFFAFLINNWSAFASAINQSGALLGLKAGGGAMTMADLHNPGAIAGIGQTLFGKTIELTEGLNFLTDFATIATIYLAAIGVLLSFFVLALQVFIALIAFKLGALAAFVALPWGVFNGTAWVAERPLGWVGASAMRLFMLALTASIAVNFVDTLPQTFTLESGGVLNVLLFAVTILALSWFAPQLASEVVQGQPNLSAGDGVRAGLGGAGLVIGAGAAGVYGLRAGAQAISGRARAAGRLTTAARAGGGEPSPPAPIDHSKFQPPQRKAP